MRPPRFAFSTGIAPLPDIGELSYNGVTFSSLFKTRARGEWVKDSANRTVKYYQLSIEASGVVTILDGNNTDTVMANMLILLNQQGGRLAYMGRGYGPRMIVNNPGPNNGVSGNDRTFRDVAWGPVPETIDFQPLGGGRSAMVNWRVVTRISQYPIVQFVGPVLAPIVELTVENDVTYDEEGYSTLRISGTVEVAITRSTPQTRQSSVSVDDVRSSVIQQLMSGIDLTRFRIARRHFPISRDRRTMQFEIVAEELPPMGDPPGATNARGRFTVRPASSRGAPTAGTISWICSLSITYTIRKDMDRRLAYLAFMYMVWYRMQFSAFGNLPAQVSADGKIVQDQNLAVPVAFPPLNQPFVAGNFYANPFAWYFRQAVLRKRQLGAQGGNVLRAGPPVKERPKAWLIDFGVEEGMHRDSKTVTFEASWMLLTEFSYLMRACGLWQFDKEAVGGPVWAQSIQDISGWRSWLSNEFDPTADVIVDLGL